MSMLKEFKEFAAKGNVVDLAVGVIIGASFGKIVTSLVGDVVTPPLGLLLGGVDFSHLALTLKAAADGAPAVQLRYGQFLQAVVDFLIVGGAVFLLVKGINALRRKQEAAPAEVPADVKLLEEIRDLLKATR